MSTQLVWLQKEWAARLAAALEAMAGVKVEFEPLPLDDLEVEPGSLELEVGTNLDREACLWVNAPAATWEAIGGKVLESAGLVPGAGEERKGTFLEVLRQSLGPLTGIIEQRVKQEVEFTGATELSEVGEIAVWAPVRLTLAGAPLPPIRLAISDALEGRLRGEALPSRSSEPEILPSAFARSGPRSKTMDLLMEVQLPLAVSFGRTQMRLKEAVKLTTGSIVELNRTVTDPVEMIVNNCVIARGEVVVVDGNYGVRITEIVSREERLRTLF